ncbi:MAG: hypothetical protein HONBIEJF_01496 [Fimbriimonadaceae bacterium]|nr:hypothetical protein [Fimbriimonadaceae bacterium]
MLACALAVTLLPAQVAGPKLVIVSWDGAPDWVVDRLLAEGKLPNVARLAREGVSSESVIAAFPSKTAVGHAAIFTGCWGDDNGIVNNTVPRLPIGEHTLLETYSGFDSRSLRAEPAYVTLAKDGLKVCVLSATQSYPPEPHVDALKKVGAEGRFTQFSGFESPLSEGQMIGAERFDEKPAAWEGAPKHTGRVATFSFKLADTAFFGLAYDSSDDPAIGFDTVAIRKASTGAAAETLILKPAEAREDSTKWSKAVRIRSGQRQANTSFRLFELKSDGSSMALYCRKASALPGAHTAEQEEQYLSHYPGFHDDEFSPYERGIFGKPKFSGGDGTAERRLLEVVKSDCDYLAAGTAFVLDTWKPDVIFHYTPMSDSAGHTWMGYMDPEVEGVDPAVRAYFWECYERVFQMQDAWLGTILDKVGPETVVALVSDHGMQGVTSYANVNAILAKAGLATFGPEGRIDLSKTKVCAPPWADFGLVVNTVDRKGGIVALADKKKVLQDATTALLSARDPDGSAIVTSVMQADVWRGLGLGGASGADAFLDFAPGLYPSGRRSSNLTERSPEPFGVHGFVPYRAKMQTVFYARGKGLARGAKLSTIRQVDIMPTLCRALGATPPPKAIGNVIGQAIDK